MFSAMLFAIALVAMGQFALYYWRAVFTGVASLPISSRVLEAAHVDEMSMSGNDFGKLVSLHHLTPELKEGKSGLGFVRMYYGILRRMGSLTKKISPMLSAWTEKERLLCARFAAVQIERRLQANLMQAASIRSI
ncbi:MAG TPA: hypothetical protein VL128_10575 [Candidatus Eisenbacteria bacterium]|nr:hypothetical protein [Candidatus Eisenbacteria bacterium]